jgi:flagellar biosynthesis/type III secretory pathway protein FliH
MSAVAEHPESAVRRRRGLVGLLLLAVIVAVGSWYAGASMSPTRAEADVARAEARAQAAETARSEQLESAYLDAYREAFDSAAADAAREGRIAGEAAARDALQ